MKTLLFLLPNLLWNPGALEPSLTLSGSGVELQGHTGSSVTGGSFAAIRGSFTLQKTDEARLSGWSWGFAAGATRGIYDLGHAIAPATYFWELMFGRGTTESFSGGESGLRGYLEAALRDQRPEANATLRRTLDANGLTLKDHNTALVIRMGVANDYAGRGLVEQGPPKLLFRLQTSLYLPMFDASTNRVFLGANAATFLRCGIRNLSCGLEVGFLQSSNAGGGAEIFELYRHMAYGPSLELKWKETYAFKLKAQWTAAVGSSGPLQLTVWSQSPTVDALLTMKF